MSDEKAREMFDTEILYFETVDTDDIIGYLFDELIQFKDMPLEEGSFDKLDYDQLNFVVSTN